MESSVLLSLSASCFKCSDLQLQFVTKFQIMHPTAVNENFLMLVLYRGKKIIILPGE